jgi:hypothetical protein
LGRSRCNKNISKFIHFSKIPLYPPSFFNISLGVERRGNTLETPISSSNDNDWWQSTKNKSSSWQTIKEISPLYSWLSYMIVIVKTIFLFI